MGIITSENVTVLLGETVAKSLVEEVAAIHEVADELVVLVMIGTCQVRENNVDSATAPAQYVWPAASTGGGWCLLRIHRQRNQRHR
jgi:hypothetical protein